MQELHREMGDQRGLLGRFGQHRVACHQRGAHLPREDGEWKIPGTDAGEHAAAMQGQLIALPRRPGQHPRRREHPPSLGRVVAQEIDGFADLRDGIVHGLAGFARAQHHEFGQALLEQRGRLVQ